MKTKQRDHSLLHTGWSSQFLNTAHMTPLFISVLLAAMCLECRAQKDNVLQPEGDVTATEGDAVILGCLYNSSSTNDYLYWYKQDGNSPTFILSRFRIGTGETKDLFKERFSSTLDSTSRSVPLKIQKLQVSDSAVYYCALQPTVTGNTKTLYKNLWSKDNTILHNIHQRETQTVKLQWFVAGSQSPISLMLRRRAVQQTLFSCFILLQWKNTVHLLSDFNNSKDMLLYFFLFSSHFIGLTAGDTISPVEDEVTGREGESVKLTCRYQTTATYIYLHWYKHHSDLEAPQYILWKGAKGNPGQYIPDNRYESQTSDASTELTIKSLTLADTALYYCALETQ
uniref:Ig-like domain-containing protein n=1 Tax=Mastacembelus armatus TaxID=205130 RepID=A0A7N8WHW1_9TELE